MSKKIKYVPVYKCRYCNALHSSSYNNVYKLPEVVVDTLIEVQNLPTILYNTHEAQYYKEEPHIGISDLVGFGKVEVDEEDN